MTADYFNIQCPEELDDEVFMIETAGEMPEVALAESLDDLGEIAPSWRTCLEAAVARSYVAMIARDLDPANIGQSHFRGLDRAMANYQRLRAFLAKCGQKEPIGLAKELAELLDQYLSMEKQAIEGGRRFASAKAADVSEMCDLLGLPSQRHIGLLSDLDNLPSLDCRALNQLYSLAGAEGSAKRRTTKGSQMIIEIIGPDGQTVQSAALPVLDPRGEKDPALMRRAETVWSLLDVPEFSDIG